MIVRRRYFHDEIVGEDGAALVLVGGTLTHVEQIGVCVLALADDWIAEEEIAERLVELFGEDPEDTRQNTRNYCASLVEGGLLERRDGEPGAGGTDRQSAQSE